MKLFKTYRRLTTKERLNLIYIMYKSLTDFKQRRERPSVAAKELGLTRQTVHSALTNFETYGKNIKRFLIKPKPKGRPIALIGSHEIERKLLSARCLKNWAHLSIAQRCEKIWEKHRVEVKRHKLTLFYKRNGVRCTTSYNKYFPHGHNLLRLKYRRMEYAQDLAEGIVNNQPIIYVDETTFRTDMVQKKSWYFKKQRFQVPAARMQNQGASFTVYGALGECLQGKGFYYAIGDSTNSDDFLDFITNLFGEVVPLPSGVKPVVVLDNHRAHLGERKERMEQLGFQPAFLPIYSSEMNAIETVWSLLKQSCRR